MECNNACGKGWCCTGWFQHMQSVDREYIKLALWRGLKVYKLKSLPLHVRLAHDVPVFLVSYPCWCKHRQDSGFCGIQEDKPKVCRDFPRDEGLHLLPDECPLEGENFVRMSQVLQITEDNLESEVPDESDN